MKLQSKFFTKSNDNSTSCYLPKAESKELRVKKFSLITKSQLYRVRRFDFSNALCIRSVFYRCRRKTVGGPKVFSDAM